MNILFICTTAKDRSPALVKYFSANYPQHEYKCAGINNYLCKEHCTHLLTQEDVDWAHLIVCAEKIHYDKALNYMFRSDNEQQIVLLACGEYKAGEINEGYLQRAEEKLKPYLIT